MGVICVGRSEAFNPTGDLDLGPADLNALCPMLKEFGENPGQIPKSQKIVEAPVNKDECVYFKWNSCPGKPDPKNPCGHYQMTKCPETKGKRDIWEDNEGDADTSMAEMDADDGPTIDFQNYQK
ncbi:unnamed protein product [Allacma fusca]|uniref:Uncharacterized protein n=1 Tax=Allacma fusca TaxID=39272 RepID=A0A8J2LIZ0_9HEXA|nr:unnamed protein product [Allacma fusca]